MKFHNPVISFGQFQKGFKIYLKKKGKVKKDYRANVNRNKF